MSSSGGNEEPQRRSSGIPLQTINTSPPGEATSSRSGASVIKPLNQSASSSATTSANLLGPSTYWDQPYDAHYHDIDGLESPIDPSALQVALPPNIRGPIPHGSGRPIGAGSPYIDETPASDCSGSDREPLTAHPQPIAGSLAANLNDGQPRDSFQTVSDVDNSGRDVQGHRRDIEYGLRPHQHHGFGMSLNPNEYRLSRSSSSAGALQRAGSIVRAMSQRVVNISGESEIVDNRASRHRSSSPQPSLNQSRNGSRTQSPAPSREPSRTRSISMLGDTSYHSQTANLSPEKDDRQHLAPGGPPYQVPLQPLPNPLRGKSLGIFSRDSRVRNWLCDLLVNPYTEPFILILIVAQTVLLAVESGQSVFEPGHERPEFWGQQATDWAMLGLFIVFTLELIIRIIVSGFILNAAEYSTIDRKRGIRAAVADQYRAIFQPHQAKAARNHNSFKPTPSAFARSFTTILQGPQRLPETLEEQQRYQLARRAFLRHGFNRLDFIAVSAFWISFILGVTGAEKDRGLYVFKMLSCLRILRLLSITNGTAVILRSLKKAAPLLVRVAFFISFFWLLFAIVGVQSFKESLSRQCVWVNPQDPNNLTAAFTNAEAFCGGYINETTGAEEPWVRMVNSGSLAELDAGTSEAKGFICPRGSLCLQQGNPQGGTVSFDDIFHSLELVFIIMSANTFTDIMYWTMGSDYMLAALYFGAGIMIMLLWLVNLLIAVITSSFQVIREESKSSAFTTAEEPSTQVHAEARFRKPSFIQNVYAFSKNFWITVIIFGLVASSLRSSSMSIARGRFIDLAEVVVTILLDLEMILRIAADWRGFHRSWPNLFDLSLAVITSIILLPPIRGSRAYWWLSIFQIVRVYRVVLAVPVTRKLILLVLGNASGIANLMLFVFLTTFLVAILAAQLFRGVLPEGSDVTFYNMFNSFVGMYQILTSENWTDILYNVTETTTAFGTSWIGATFLIGWFILSFFILINMFIAVIQENFDISEDEKRFEQVKAFLQRREIGSSSSNLALSTIFSFGRTRQRKDPLDYGPALTEMLLKDSVVSDFLEESYNRGAGKTEQEPGPTRATTGLLTNDIRPSYVSTLWAKLVRKIIKREPNPFYSNIRLENSSEHFDAREMAQQAVNATSTRRKAQREYLAKHPNYNTSLYLFSPKHKLRRFCQTIVGPARGLERIDGVEPNKIAWYSFSAFIYCAIVAMVVIACVTTPLYQKQYRTEHPASSFIWYVWTDMAFAILFSAESTIKIIADGLFWTPNAYLRSSWGLVDSVVLITLWINVVTMFVNDGAISRAVGAFKALRALRLLNVSDSARDTFHSLIIKGWWKILAAAFVSISLLIPFAIYGLNLFNGLLIACNDDNDIVSLASCFGEFGSTPFSNDWPMLAPRVATNPYFNFDDFGASLFTLFQIVSQEGWSDVVFAASAITSRGMQPQSLASEGNAVFFIVFNILATVFVLTLFISVFMRNYTEQTGVAFLTADQRSWLEVRKLLRQISPSKSSYNDKGKAWKKWCHKRAIEKRGKWYQAVTLVLVLHLIMLVTESTRDPEWWRITRSFTFLGFIVIYMANITIRIIGLGWTRYRRSSWDLYALIAVFGAFVSTAAMLIANSGNMQVRDETYVQVHKFFLVAIVLMVIPRNDALDQLFKTAAASLTVIGNLLATWLVLFLVFAIAFTQAFSLTRFGSNETNNVNFRTVPKALILLFRMSFGEGWNSLMEDFAFIEPPLCVEQENDFFRSDCGSKSWARFLFVAWNIISMYIFVSLFVSLIYESFSYVYQRSSGMGAIDRDEIRRFKEAWRSVDPDGTGWISKETFPRLLGELSGVFQMRIYEPEDSVHSILEDVRGHDARGGRHLSIVSSTNATSIDLDALNQRLAMLNVPKIRERRRRFNLFYGEIMTTADVDRGINFTNVLMTLAHHNIVTDGKSLKLDEFLRRRARLQRVEEDIRRRIVQGFFKTLYLSREFKKHMRQKDAGRMTGIPEIMVPDIYVDDDNIDDLTDDGKYRTSGLVTPASHLSVDLSQGDRGSRASGGSRGSRGSSSARQSAWINAGQHPLSEPRAQYSNPASPSHQATTSAFSFELFDPDAQGSSANEMRRRGSANSPTRAPDMMDDTVWKDSIRKSTTIRRSGKSASYRFTDLG